PGTLLERAAAQLPFWAEYVFAASGVLLLALMNNVWRWKYYLSAAGPCVLLALCAVLLAAGRVRSAPGLNSGAASASGAAPGSTPGRGAAVQLLFPCLVFSALIGLAILASYADQKMSTPHRFLYSSLNALGTALLIFWLLLQRHVGGLILRLAALCGRKLKGDTPGRLFTAAMLIYALLIFFYHPVSLFHSDPAFFVNPLPAILGGLFFRLLIFIGVFRLIYRKTGPALRPLLAVGAAWLALCSLLYSFVIIFDYGEMNGPFLQYVSKFSSPAAVAADVAIFLASALLVWLVLRRGWAGLLTGALRSLCAVALLAGALQIFTAEGQEEQSAQLEELPGYHERLFSFSREDKNILVFILDAFTGDHMEKLLAEEPELMAEFTGFTWYADNISPGRRTSLSMAAIAGGERYLPVEVNRRADNPLKEEIVEAYTVLPGLLLPNDYDVALVNLEWMDETIAAQSCPRISETLITHNAGRDFVSRWLEQNNYSLLDPPNQASFLSIFGLFRASPSLLRKHIYRQGSWMHTYALMAGTTSGWYAMFEAMRELASPDSPRPTYKAFHSQITHSPWDLNADCVPVTDRYLTYADMTRHKDGYMVEHYWAERCALRSIAGLLRWLKENGLYDNTQIFILSDHSDGDNIAHRNIPKPYGNAIRDANALLLVKNFKENHPLAVDRSTQTSGADVLALICRAGGFCGDLDYYDPLAAQE
ncbi:hypothetical protein LJC36_06450, partial [Desulfovibrio sp. OttesenSCG-928-C14]|nr:hypothetical protein [Desulfovibrio sp. OttesenSCG-928-C14]